MRNVIQFLIYLTFLCSPLAAFGAADTSCECPKLSCNTECEVEQDLTFYSEKCGDGQRVRSCSRPTCLKREDAPASCGMASAATPAAKPIAAAPADEPDRDVASAPVDDHETVGRVKFLEGTAYRVVSPKNKANLNVGDEVHEKDHLETDATGKVQILFNSGNILNITPNSEIVIFDGSDSLKKVDKKRMVLDLIKGKVRSKVNQKYEGNEQSHYRVRTGAAVAGVRGTDFTVSAYEEGKNIIAKIETLSGTVELSDRGFEKKVSITKGEGATFVAAKDSLISDKQKAEFIAKGFLTPVYKMSGEQIENLEKETRFASLEDAAAVTKKRRPASSDEPICASPSGQLNECAWSCENNPSGEKRCRTDLPQVSCVRRICNANGAWSQPTRLPASFHDACVADHAVVKPCDY